MQKMANGQAPADSRLILQGCQFKQAGAFQTWILFQNKEKRT